MKVFVLLILCIVLSSAAAARRTRYPSVVYNRNRYPVVVHNRHRYPVVVHNRNKRSVWLGTNLGSGSVIDARTGKKISGGRTSSHGCPTGAFNGIGSFSASGAGGAASYAGAGGSASFSSSGPGGSFSGSSPGGGMFFNGWGNFYGPNVFGAANGNLYVYPAPGTVCHWHKCPKGGIHVHIKGSVGGGVVAGTFGGGSGVFTGVSSGGGVSVFGGGHGGVFVGNSVRSKDGRSSASSSASSYSG